jgi:hypothetical protein
MIFCQRKEWQEKQDRREFEKRKGVFRSIHVVCC